VVQLEQFDEMGRILQVDRTMNRANIKLDRGGYIITRHVDHIAKIIEVEDDTQEGIEKEHVESGSVEESHGS